MTAHAELDEVEDAGSFELEILALINNLTIEVYLEKKDDLSDFTFLNVFNQLQTANSVLLLRYTPPP